MNGWAAVLAGLVLTAATAGWYVRWSRPEASPRQAIPKRRAGR